MTLSPKTRLQDLLRRYPFLEASLVGLSPRFRLLRQPLMRGLLARTATLEKIAATGGVDLQRLMQNLAAEIRAKTGEEAQIAASSAAPEDRARTLKEIIRDLHRGVPVERVKQRFAELVKDVEAAEIAEMEQRLMKEGISEEEIKRLCDVHVEVFREALERKEAPAAPPGHPVRTFMEENRMAESLLEKIGRIFGDDPAGIDVSRLVVLMRDLSAIERHYRRKENQLFPLLEARGIGGPTEVMWAIHDDIRNLLNTTCKELDVEKIPEARACFGELRQKIGDMIYKEEHILFPLALETLSDNDWARARRGEEEIGYAWVKPGTDWTPEVQEMGPPAGPPGGPRTRSTPQVRLSTGELSPEQIDLLLTHLPMDITFVNEKDEVAYYSATRERIFPRSPGVIGRKVQKCHPPKSVHVVERILEEFKAGRREAAEFWIRMAGKLILIRYYPVRDRGGRYRGTLEVTQDVTGIRELEGERRLLDWA